MDYCCEEVQRHIEEFGRWMGGSHYHCGRCNGLSGMYGHHRRHSSFTNGKFTFDMNVPAHFCCPNDCELDSSGG